MSRRLVGYYQSFNPQLDFSQLFSAGLTHVHLASVHFGVEDDGQPYIHLNDLAPSHSNFDFVWAQMAEFKRCGGTVMLMIGGAGGGYETLLNPKYGDVCRALLLELLITKKAILDGVDYDIEEPVDVNALLRVHGAMRAARPDLHLSFAPLGSSLQSDEPGMGGFSYKPLLDEVDVNYFNGQFYGDYGREAFGEAVENGYPASKVVMGCLAGQENATTDAVRATCKAFPLMGGVFVWEIGQTTPNPPEWVATMHTVLQEAGQTGEKGRPPAIIIDAQLPLCTIT